MTVTRVLACVMALLSCQALGGEVEKPLGQEQCQRIGGQWCQGPNPICGLEGRCDLPATDAGKPCTDATQCEGSCVPVSARPVLDERAAGQCSTHRDSWLAGPYWIDDGR